MLPNRISLFCIFTFNLNYLTVDLEHQKIIIRINNLSTESIWDTYLNLEK